MAIDVLQPVTLQFTARRRGKQMSEKRPENKEAPNKMEQKPQGKTDTIKALGGTAIKGAGGKK
jgi:hypothetical protein